jgi:uncharacterized protein YoxC
MQDVIGWIAVALAIALCAILLVALGSILQTLRASRRILASLESQVIPLVDELEATVRRAGAEVDHLDEVLGSVTAVSRTLEDASLAATNAVTTPVVKVLALSAGTRSAYQRFRHRRTRRK